MRQKKIVSLSLMLVLSGFCFISLVFAENIYLKSGKVVKAKIIEKTDKYIKVDFEGVTLTYFNEDIDHIEADAGGAIAPQGQTGSHSSGDQLSFQEQVNHYEAILKNDPNNFDAHWNLAGIYLSTGFGPQAASHIEKAMAIDKEKAVKEDAYTMLTMAYYYSGEFKKSAAAVEEALKINPNNEAALGLKSALDAVSKRDFGGKLPDKAKWGGQESAGEMGMAMLKEGTGVLGDKEDSINFDFAQFHFTPPAGWYKKDNLRNRDGAISFLAYKKDLTSFPSMILVTRDFPGAGVNQAIDFTRQMRQLMLSEGPGFHVAEPQNVTIAGYPAATYEMWDDGGKIKTYWYQFLIEGNIISLQLIAAPDRFNRDFAEFKKFAESMKIVKAPAGK